MVIVGSVAGATSIERLSGTVVVVGRSAGATVVVVVVGKGSESTVVEGLAGTPVQVLASTLVVIINFNRREVAGRLTGTVTRTGLATTNLMCSLALLAFPPVFCSQQ